MEITKKIVELPVLPEDYFPLDNNLQRVTTLLNSKQYTNTRLKTVLNKQTLVDDILLECESASSYFLVADYIYKILGDSKKAEYIYQRGRNEVKVQYYSIMNDTFAPVELKQAKAKVYSQFIESVKFGKYLSANEDELFDDMEKALELSVTFNQFYECYKIYLNYFSLYDKAVECLQNAEKDAIDLREFTLLVESYSILKSYIKKIKLNMILESIKRNVSFAEKYCLPNTEKRLELASLYQKVYSDDKKYNNLLKTIIENVEDLEEYDAILIHLDKNPANNLREKIVSKLVTKFNNELIEKISFNELKNYANSFSKTGNLEIIVKILTQLEGECVSIHDWGELAELWSKFIKNRKKTLDCLSSAKKEIKSIKDYGTYMLYLNKFYDNKQIIIQEIEAAKKYVKKEVHWFYIGSFYSNYAKNLNLANYYFNKISSLSEKELFRQLKES